MHQIILLRVVSITLHVAMAIKQLRRFESDALWHHHEFALGIVKVSKFIAHVTLTLLIGEEICV